MKTIVLGIVLIALLAADPGEGERTFGKRCSGCHALDADKEGPRLRSVLGRKAGSISGFPYSDELRKSGIVWDEGVLDKWLENPQRLVPGTDMEFRVPNPDERSSLLAYLKSLSAR